MIVEVLTTLSLIVNIGYQIPQVLVLYKNASSEKSMGSGDEAKSKQPKSALNVNTILLKTTASFFSIGYYFNNGVPILSWLHQICSVLQEFAMMYFWWVFFFSFNILVFNLLTEPKRVIILVNLYNCNTGKIFWPQKFFCAGYSLVKQYFSKNSC